MNKSYLVKKIKDVFIVKEYDGSYNLFGTYVIRPQNLGTFVVSTINDPYAEDIEFSSLKYAVTYCVFEKNHKGRETNRIVELDRYIAGLDVSIAQQKKLMNKREVPDKFIYLAKLSEDQLRRKNAQKEIDGYAAHSKYLQTKKYQEYQDEK
jgi:predicted membrane chloride channel (bestrophin family)